MSAPPDLALTEAITSLAFNNPVVAAQINGSLASGTWGMSRDVALGEIAKAVAALGHAGVDGRIVCWGKRAATDPLEHTEMNGSSTQLTPTDYLDYSRYIPGHDALWRGVGEPDEAANAFNGFVAIDCISDVRVKRSDLEALRQVHRGAPKFTEAERRQWIIGCPERNGDEAYRQFKACPKYDGTTQDAFRAERRKLLGNAGRGRRQSSVSTK
jgi:hypothetical protein